MSRLLTFSSQLSRVIMRASHKTSSCKEGDVLRIIHKVLDGVSSAPNVKIQDVNLIEDTIHFGDVLIYDPELVPLFTVVGSNISFDWFKAQIYAFVKEETEHVEKSLMMKKINFSLERVAQCVTSAYDILSMDIQSDSKTFLKTDNL
jgi:hypothetical protein